jgi:hypothetical protein
VDPRGGLLAIDPVELRVVGMTPVALPPNVHVGLMGDEEALWLSSDTTALLRINPRSGQVVASLDVGGGIPMALAQGLVWGAGPHHVWAVDPASNEIRVRRASVPIRRVLNTRVGRFTRMSMLLADLELKGGGAGRMLGPTFMPLGLKLVPIVLDIHPARSMLDVGCGWGTLAFKGQTGTAAGQDAGHQPHRWPRDALIPGSDHIDFVRARCAVHADRIIVGEVRGGEAFDLLQALNTGHAGTLSTIHANTAEQALTRLASCVVQSGIELPYQAVRHQIADAIDLVLHLARRQGSRVVDELVQVSRYDVERDRYELVAL